MQLKYAVFFPSMHTGHQRLVRHRAGPDDHRARHHGHAEDRRRTVGQGLAVRTKPTRYTDLLKSDSALSHHRTSTTYEIVLLHERGDISREVLTL